MEVTCFDDKSVPPGIRDSAAAKVSAELVMFRGIR